jgi:hypothetical protein
MGSALISWSETVFMIAVTKALMTRLDLNSGSTILFGFKTYKTPKPMVAHSCTLSDVLIFSFQIIVAGKTASAKSVKQLMATGC